MKDRLYDRMLVWLGIAGPLLMVALGAWRSSLERWYAPLDEVPRDTFGAQFEEQVSDWLAETPIAGSQLVLIVDSACPCTRATLTKLDEALTQSVRRDIHITIRDVNDAGADPKWRKLLEHVPSTPTVLAVHGTRLLYAGPVTSGSFCTTSAGRVLAATALQASRTSPLVNSVEKGCYCSRAQHSS